MSEIKYSKKADNIVNLYRCALYLAQGDVDTGLQFLKKASFPQFNYILKEKLNTEKDQKYWAEKILDQYLILKNSLLV